MIAFKVSFYSVCQNEMADWLQKPVSPQKALIIILLIRHKFRHIAVDNKSNRETNCGTVESGISLDFVDNLECLNADICTKHKLF